MLLPRKYLSYSAWHCFRTNPDRFRREYFEKENKLDTKYLRFGKGIAEMIEQDTYKTLLPDLPVYPMRELKIETEIDGVPILSFLDGFDSTTGVIGEYKTGKRPWTQAMVQKHEQLLFYAAVVRKSLGVLPTSAQLHWIETTEATEASGDFWEYADPQLKVTGKIVTFTREFDTRELDRIEKEIVKTALDISSAYEAFINEI